MFFDARLRAILKDGTAHAGASGLSVRGAREVTLILAAGTSFNGFDKSPSREGADAGRTFPPPTWRGPRRSRIRRFATPTSADYKRLFDRVSLDLGAPSGTEPACLRTSASRASPTIATRRLAALYFHSDVTS